MGEGSSTGGAGNVLTAVWLPLWDYKRQMDIQ